MHHSFAAVRHRSPLLRFQQNVQKESLHDKGQCMNTAIKYYLFCSWKVNYLKNNYQQNL